MSSAAASDSGTSAVDLSGDLGQSYDSSRIAREFGFRKLAWGGTKAVGAVAIGIAGAIMFPPALLVSLGMLASVAEDAGDYLWTRTHWQAPEVQTVVLDALTADTSTRQGRRRASELGRDRPAIDYTVDTTGRADRYSYTYDAYRSEPVYGEALSRAVIKTGRWAAAAIGLAIVGFTVPVLGGLLLVGAGAATVGAIAQGIHGTITTMRCEEASYRAQLAEKYTRQNPVGETAEAATTAAPEAHGLGKVKQSLMRGLGRRDTPAATAPEPTPGPEQPVRRTGPERSLGE